jgi:hypothetical protein
MWEPHDVAEVLERWTRHVPTDRVTVIVADEQDRNLLPRTFEGLLGLPVNTLVPPVARSNSSLSYPATEAVRRINALAYAEEWTPTEYWRLVQGGVAQRLKQRGASDEPRLRGVPEAYFELVADRADAQVRSLASAGVTVVGDRDQLRLRERVRPVEAPPAIETISLDLFSHAIGGVRAGSEKLRTAEKRAAARQSVATPTRREAIGSLARRILNRLRSARGPGRHR